jgi:quercetin dioxygenase-like cupin family protein
VRAFFKLTCCAFVLALLNTVNVASQQAGIPVATPVVKLEIAVAVRSDAKTAMTKNVLPGEIPGIRTTALSLASGVPHRESPSVDEDRVYLVLAGNGNFIAGGKKYSVMRETIAHFPLGWDVDIEASSAQGLDILILYLTLIPADREDLSAHPDLSQAAYVKTFQECEPYREKIKSPKTISRTLLPKNVVPRMAIGTVETTGPDKVDAHRHPMLEQYFLGLETNDIVVVHNGTQTPLKANELFHIPTGSNHGVRVAKGRKLYYVWMDFFQDRKGLEWLNEHKPLAPAKKP